MKNLSFVTQNLYALHGQALPHVVAEKELREERQYYSVNIWGIRMVSY